MTVVPGSPINMKITTKEDQRLAEHALKALPKPKLAGPLQSVGTMICGGERGERRGERGERRERLR